MSSKQRDPNPTQQKSPNKKTVPQTENGIPYM